VPCPPVLAEVVRNGFVESRHRGSLVVLDPGGRPVCSLGDVTVPIFPRSAVKPVQALAMLRCGLALDGELLALAAASHAGEQIHLDGVRRILAGAGLDESALQTPPGLPLDQVTAHEYLASGGRPSSVAMNCSGKHAAMLATCVANGWPTASYLDREHPLQRATRQTLEEISGEKVAAEGVDGCGAPLFAISLTGLARAFGALVVAAEGSPERQVADAMRAHPRCVGGSRREDSALMGAVPGVLAKIGAEGVYAAALADGGSVALKFEDGADRARPPVMAAALRRLDVTVPEVAGLAAAPVLGGGQPVGEIRAVAP
jgi:L-asparaginase II